MENLFKVGKVEIRTPGDWRDATKEIGEPDAAFTLMRPEGTGALQFSFAEYDEAGKMPEISLEALRKLLIDFAQYRELGRGHDYREQAAPLLISTASFGFEGRFLRVWYCSDGRSIALVTYNCPQGDEEVELAECEEIVRKIKFNQ
jgi:hypothetical protein